MLARLRKVLDAAIDADEAVGMLRLQTIDAAVVERRDVAVLLWRQALQPGLARMVVQGVTLFFAFATVAVNFIADLLTVAADPRVKL